MFEEGQLRLLGTDLNINFHIARY